MLFQNHFCKLQSQYFATCEQQFFQSYALSDPCHVVISLRDIFVSQPKVADTFAMEVFKLFQGKFNLTKDDYTANFEQLATYGVFLSQLVWGYNVNEENVEKRMSLYTTSMSVLKQLQSRGMLKGKKEPIEVELVNIEKRLYESDAIKKSLKDGSKIVSVRLDAETFADNVVYTPTIPRTAVNLNDYIFIPATTLSTAQDCLGQLLDSKVCRIVMGDKERIVTRNRQTLAAVYGDQRTEFLCSFNKDSRTGYFYVPVVGASIYTSGVTNIRVTEIDKISFVNSIAEIDFSDLNLDLAMVKDYFLSKFDRLNFENAKKVLAELEVTEGIDDPSEYPTLIRKIIGKMGDHILWEHMLKFPDLFSKDEYLKLGNKFGDQFMQVTNWGTKEDVEALLRVGVYKVLVRNRTGSFSTIFCSNCDDLLKKIIGADYVKYESEGVRLGKLENWLKHYSGAVSRKDLREKCNELDLLDFYFMVDSKESKAKVSSGVLTEVMSKMIYDIDSRKTVIKKPNLITVRNLAFLKDADGKAVDFYKMIDYKSIVSIVCLQGLKQQG